MLSRIVSVIAVTCVEKYYSLKIRFKLVTDMKEKWDKMKEIVKKYM